MGGTQSSANSLPDAGRIRSISVEQPLPGSADGDTDKQEQAKSNQDGLSGMPLVHKTCRKAKKSYDACVRKWYSQEFMTGGGTLNQEEACGDRFDDYRTCILRGIRREVWDKQGLPPPSDASPLADVEDEE